MAKDIWINLPVKECGGYCFRKLLLNFTQYELTDTTQSSEVVFY